MINPGRSREGKTMTELLAGGMTLTIPNARAMEELAASFARACTGGCRIYLQGELGSGKTTWVRGFLRGLDYPGAVKSPTYGIVEHYELKGRPLVHLDLYRLADPEELEWIGFRDWLSEDAVCLVEWWERGSGVLPHPDLLIGLEYSGDGRTFTARGCSTRGDAVLASLQGV